MARGQKRPVFLIDVEKRELIPGNRIPFESKEAAKRHLNIPKLNPNKVNTNYLIKERYHPIDEALAIKFHYNVEQLLKYVLQTQYHSGAKSKRYSRGDRRH